MEFTTDEELQAYGQATADEIAAALTQWDENRDRSKQSAARILGMSDLGGCREFIRATIAGDPKMPPTKLKLPAIIGTAGGDVIEEAATKYLPGATSQQTITVKMGSGIVVTGHTDLIRDRKRIVDLKSKDGIRTVAVEGPSFENLVQLSGYLVGGIQQGLLDDDAVGILVYWDRAGNDKTFGSKTITHEQAIAYLMAADERLDEVSKALADGTPAPARWLQDQPESYCFHIQCEFYQQCWAGYMPVGDIIDDAQEAAVHQYEKGRDYKKLGDQLQRQAKAQLMPDWDHRAEGAGTTPDDNGEVAVIKWTTREGRRPGEMIDSIDVRRIPAPKLPF